MAQMEGGKLKLKTSFEPVDKIDSIYTGGVVAIYAKSQWLITTLGEDILITSLASGKTIHTLEGDSEVITCFAIRQDQPFLVSASRSLQLRLWNIETGENIRSWKAHDAPVICMDFAPNTAFLATGSADSSIRVWDTERGYCTHSFRGHSGVVCAARFHPKELMLYTGAENGQIRIWDLMKKKCTGSLENHVSVISSLAISDNLEYLISASRDKTVNLWSLSSKKLIKTFPVFETLEVVGGLQSHLFSKENSSTLFFTAGDNGIIRIWNSEEDEPIFTQTLNGKAHLIVNAFLFDENKLAVTTNDQNIHLYSLPDFNTLKEIAGFNEEIIDTTFVGDNGTHIAVATNSEQVRIYDMESKDCCMITGHNDIVIALSSSQSGMFLATGSKDRTAKLWKLNLKESSGNRYKCIGDCIGHTEAIGAVALSRKSLSFMLSGSQDRTIKCWDLSNIDDTENGLKTNLTSLYTQRVHDKDINSIAVSPNDKLFATGSQDKLAKIWKTEDGSLVGVCKGHKRGVWCVQFSPMDQVLATSSGDKSIKLWSIKDFTCLKTFEGHTNSVLQVMFVTAGTQLLSTGSDSLLKLWNIKSNECIATFDKHENKVWALSSKNDGDLVVTGGVDSTLVIWKDSTEIEEAKRFQEMEENIQKEQDLGNYIHRKEFKKAILLALTLEKPMKVYDLFNNWLDSEEEVDLSPLLSSLDSGNVEKLLLYIRDWNTNSKLYFTAQKVFNSLLQCFPPQFFSGLPHCKEVICGILPYTQRHYQRLDQLVTSSFLLDSVLDFMDFLHPSDSLQQESI